MCGRFQAKLKLPFKKSLFEIIGIPEPTAEDYDFPIDFKMEDVRPTDSILVLRKNDEGKYIYDIMRWGLIMKNNPAPMINSKVESIKEGNTSLYWKNQLSHNPIVIPMTGFYEWKDLGNKKKQPYKFTVKGQEIFFAAGFSRRDILTIKDKEDKNKPDIKKEVSTATIITTIGNDLTRPIHVKDRSPVLLDYECIKNFLEGDIDTKLSFCSPFPAERMEAIEEAP